MEHILKQKDVNVQKLPWFHFAERLIRHIPAVVTPLPDVPLPIINSANPFRGTI